jgi:hypothetical protein
MAIGRITGPLLASNLRRDGVNLAFETDLLFLDVVNGRIGIRRDDPQYELDVTGTIRADEIIVNTATIGLVTITSTTSSSTISSLFGDISVQPGGGDVFRIDSDTYVDGDVYATGNFFAQGDIKLGDTTSSDLISLLGRINSDVLPYVSTGTVIEEEVEGEIVETFVTNTSIVSEFSLGSTTTYWKNSYLENIYTKQIDTMGTETNVNFFPDIPRLERLLNKSVTINGDIRVYGGNPIGTFPIVNNILYVNENGSDDNDGRGMDASRACRTITGATRSPFFKQGTIIKVSPGFYLEDNPIKLLPYTSVVGDSLRGVFVQPLNNTVDLFHVNSGVYITGMTMLNLRRGEVTRFAPGGQGTYTTGAYCVAFPPSLDNPIELFHSPYIQNCTNQSGPWLYDGTMFVPNQIVQIPLVVAKSTYDANTTTLFVSIVPEVTAQMPEIGMAVNGKGILIEDDLPVATIDRIENADVRYRNAKNLLELNTEFIKEEVVSWVDENFDDFTYDRDVCKRDAGFILDALINDAILGGNKKIVEAGRAYYNGTVQILGDELEPTIAAFGRLKEAAVAVVSNIEFEKTESNLITQTLNLDLTDGDVVVDKISELVDLLIDILRNNAGYENAAALLNANRGFIQAETVAFVNETYVGQPVPSFTYDRDKCFRDVGFVIDAIATDLLFGGNEQSIAAGAAYQQGAVIPGEVEETLAGFNYLATIVRDVVLKLEVNDGYQSTVTQNTSLPAGSNAGVELLTRNIRIINKIIQDGTEGAPTLSPNGPSPTTVQSIVDSYNILIENKEFLQAEVVGYIDVTFTNLDFEYNEEKCARDTGLILDGLILDLVHGGSSQSTFAGLQYWSQGTSAIPGEETMTVLAFNYAKSIAAQIIVNAPVTLNQGTYEQNIDTTATSSAVVADLEQKFDTVVDIIENGTEGVTDRIEPNGDISENVFVIYAVENIQLNKDFIIEQVISYIETNKPSEFEYDDTKCRRDVGYILDSVSMDILRGGNRQSIQAGVYYFGYDVEAPVLINETPQTIAAYKFMKALIEKVVQRIPVTKLYQEDVSQNLDLIGGTVVEAKQLGENVDLIRNIILKGPSAAPEQVPISLAVNTSTNVTRAYNILRANRSFIVNEVVNFVNTTFIQPFVFKYNEEKCFRDVGLIVDAVASDIIRRSNANSLEAGLAYWDNAVSVINGQLKETSGAIQYAKNVALKIIANNPVTTFYQKSVEIQVPGSTETRFSSVVPQIINPQLNGGEVARSLVDNNFNAITTIIENGPAYSPFSTNSTVTDFVIHLSTSTIAAAVDDTMYFGYTTVYPEEDRKIPGEWGHNGFADRRIDPNGSGGGALVDGNAPSLRSPIQSFVFDAFTQITQGGRGIHIINEGYAQLVSVFTIFCNVAVETDTGGIASITNSNNNFGDICLMSRGFGKRKFGGTVYNPAFTAFNENTNSFEPNEFYPQGYFPERQTIAVFVPDPDNRPGISLVMEVVPPDEYVNFDGETVPYRNEQGYPGFLTAIINTGTINTGSFIISGINTDGVSVGQTIHIKDQFGYEATDNGEGEPYIEEDTIVTAVDYKTITLSKPINEGGGEQFNPFYFNVYCCGNAYYNILSSTRANSPYPIGQSKILGQETETIDAINFLRDTAAKVVTNTLIENTYTSAISQIIDTSLPGGNNAVPVIQSNLGIITNVILSGPQAAPAPVTSGTKVPFNENSAQLLEKNKLFLMNEVVGYVDDTFGGFQYDQSKCERDTGLIVDSIAFDLLYEGTTQSTFAGLQYWNQDDYVDAIGDQITTTTNAIQYAKTLAVSVAQSSGGLGPATTVGLRFDDILNILNNGTVGVTNLIVPNGEKTLDSSILSAVNGLQSNKESIQDQTIAWINSNNPGFDYNEETCRRDIGYIIDSVSFDIMHGGNRQSIMSGVYYYGFNPAETAIPGEIPQTAAAYNFIKSIIGDIITGTPISPKFQNDIDQVTNLTPGTRAEDLSAQEKINLITSIITQGPSAAPEREPISLTASTSTAVANAFKMILANRNFIKAEVIAYIDYEFGGFQYNRQKCRRDVGLMIDALVADLRSGGNFRSVEAAKTYYSREGTYHIVTVEDNVRNPLLFIDGSTVNFYQRSYQSASGYLFEYVGAGTQYGALPQVGRVDPDQTKEVVQLNNGKVFFTSTDQNGDFRIGPTLVISQATGVLSGRTFEKSLFAQMTPFILAVESGGGE